MLLPDIDGVCPVSGRDRMQALKVICPRCDASIGFDCIGSRGPRSSCHAERHAEATTVRRTQRGSQPKVNPRYKPRDPFYVSEAWLRLRYEALRRNGGHCECCGVRPSPGLSLHVDHIKPRSKFPGLELERSNLQVLCSDCNIGKGARDSTDWRETNRRLN